MSIRDSREKPDRVTFIRGRSLDSDAADISFSAFPENDLVLTTWRISDYPRTRAPHVTTFVTSEHRGWPSGDQSGSGAILRGGAIGR